jgi:leucyl aminopeptidase (aminopeptidase T)
MNSMEKAAKTAIEICMAVKKGERVLVITDKHTKDVGQALFDASEKIADTTMIVIPPTGVSGKEPPKEVASMMKKFDVVLAPTKYSLTHTYARKNACRAGARIATLPGITNDMFARTINIDYKEMLKLSQKLANALKGVDKVKVTTNSGTNIIMEIKGRRVDVDSGLYHKRGEFGNLPAGEVSLSPKKKKSNGVIVIDSMEGIAEPKTKTYVKNGLVQEVSGDRNFRDKLWKYKNARNIAELGIGTNPNAKVVGNILEDEKVLGTCHIAYGSNISYGGSVKSDVHWDAILLRPTIFLDKRKIMDSGELLL